jgi:flagellar assembly factor FliW
MTVMTRERTENLHFAEPLPGFPEEDEYTLTPIDEQGVLYSLRAVHEPGLRFVLAAPEAFFADYRPELADALAPLLGADDVSVLLMLTIGTGLADATANLRAPVVVAGSTGRAVQVVLDDENLPMDQPLVHS